MVTTIKDMPVKWCSISLSEVIDRGSRLEASVYDVKAKQSWEHILKSKFPIRHICGSDGLGEAYVRGRFKRIWLQHSDLPIFQPSTIREVYPRPDGYLSHNTNTDIEALRVHKGQVLLTCSGTIGKVAYVGNTLDNCIFSHDLIRINFRNTSDAGYVYAYLGTKLGNKILLTNSYGAVVTHIEPDHLATIPIPDAPVDIKKRINDLVVKSYDLCDESNALIDEATDILIKELALPPIEEFKKAAPSDSFSVKLSEMNMRLDASYHLPIIDAITEHLQAHAGEVTTIEDERVSKEVILPPRFARVYVEKSYGRVLIGGKQIWELDPSGKKYLSRAKHKELLKELEVSPNTTLITRSGTIGKIALVPQHWDKWIPSDHIIRVVPANDDIAGYLYIFLTSAYGYELLTRNTYGSVIDEIDDNQVRKVAFPLLKNKEAQSRINSLALKANEKRYEAYALEQEALQIMNDEVIYAK